MRIIRLDKRHTGHGIFTHMVEPYGRGNEPFEQFQAWRIWCWETFGASSERGYVKLVPGAQGMRADVCWCWYTEYHNFRLYFRDEATFGAFLLRWS